MIPASESNIQSSGPLLRAKNPARSNRNEFLYVRLSNPICFFGSAAYVENAWMPATIMSAIIAKLRLERSSAISMPAAQSSAIQGITGTTNLYPYIKSLPDIISNKIWARTKMTGMPSREFLTHAAAPTIAAGKIK